MKKIPMYLLTAAALLLASCGPATYDSNNPEESSAKMLEECTPEQKQEFARAIQKITLDSIKKKNMSLMQLAQISQNPEKAKELLQCIDGKTVEEIIEMSKSL